jgi:hypothetical protein
MWVGNRGAGAATAVVHELSSVLVAAECRQNLEVLDCGRLCC